MKVSLGVAHNRGELGYLGCWPLLAWTGALAGHLGYLGYASLKSGRALGGLAHAWCSPGRGLADTWRGGWLITRQGLGLQRCLESFQATIGADGGRRWFEVSRRKQISSGLV